jgi:hypothetical protein
MNFELLVATGLPAVEWLESALRTLGEAVETPSTSIITGHIWTFFCLVFRFHHPVSLPGKL